MDKRAPITVKFEIPYFTVSGIQVRYLKIVEKSGYQALPWVRYITQNGDDYRRVHRSTVVQAVAHTCGVVCERRRRKEALLLHRYDRSQRTTCVFLACYSFDDTILGNCKTCLA